ncbi:DNA-binding domain-containing protein [Candidatus Formimonas warabiya]|uniref:Stage 0 sporulation protein A homolog n=1 Tax=Formimonas warabiya TaxID=1761012 RepID=A0A3G1KRK1_FORW1|nr:DNA-binding domain-containing protein [Candidatus Formimonas warabiya]ATW25081.1 hypothetical protein DCMF_10095 [Candidatus Formimonas warabiya]
MKYYIVDDDEGMVRVLTKIIEKSNLGEVVGFAYDGETALKKILVSDVNIVLVDFLMPKLDGVSLIREIKQAKPDICLIMVSQVSHEELVTSAYEAGIEFFISKPINKVEVEKVAQLVAEKMELQKMLGKIQRVINSKLIPTAGRKDKLKDVKRLLGVLGMLGEKGTNDIIRIVMYLNEKRKPYEECDLNTICSALGENPIIVKQRIRRAIKKGLTNMAYLGLEDYYNEQFQSYAGVLFDFGSVKAEMAYLKGQGKSGGKANIDKFMEGLLLQI